MIWRALLILGLLTPQPALANTSCDALLRGDAKIAQGQPRCDTGRMIGGGTQHTCYWTHAYRAPGAQAQFDQLRAVIETCLGTDAALPADMPVNHPDSFVLNRYAAQGVQVSLSLKDKGKLRQTLVFLTLEVTP